MDCAGSQKSKYLYVCEPSAHGVNRIAAIDSFLHNRESQKITRSLKNFGYIIRRLRQGCLCAPSISNKTPTKSMKVKACVRTARC